MATDMLSPILCMAVVEVRGWMSALSMKVYGFGGVRVEGFVTRFGGTLKATRATKLSHSHPLNSKPQISRPKPSGRDPAHSTGV